MKKIIVPVVLAAVLVAIPCLAENPKIENESNGHFYQSFTKRKSWTDAKSSCEKLGGYLVTITSEEERLFLMNNVFEGSGKSFWAGATDSETEGQWRWITGEPLVFTDWAKGEPNDENKEDYLELPAYFDYRWNDVPDAVKPNCYVCEWDGTTETDLEAESDKNPESKPETSKAAGTETVAPEAEKGKSDHLASQADESASESRTYYIPLFEYSENFLTGIGLSNSSTTEKADILITVFDPEGGEIMTESVDIVPDGQRTLVLYPDAAGQGWISIDSDQPLTGVCFMIAAGAGADNFMADIPLVREKQRNLHVPHVSCDDAWDTTFFVANPNGNAQTVSMDVVDPNGTPVVSEKAEIAPNGCVQFSLSSLLGQNNLVGGKAKIFGPDGVTAFALYTNIKTGARSFAGISPMEPF